MFIVTGPADQVIEFFRGPPQHDAHMKGWRWHVYIRDDHKRMESVRAEFRKMIAERRAAEAAAEAREAFQEAAE